MKGETRDPFSYRRLDKITKMKLLSQIIRDEFNGHVKKQDDIVKYMTRKHRWGNKTTRRYLDHLVNSGGLSCKRTINRWYKEYFMGD